MTYFFSFVIALSVTVLCIPVLMRIAARWQFHDLPNERKIHTVAMPRVGGFGLAAGALVPMFMNLPMNGAVLAFLFASLIVLAFGLWDDLRELDYRFKLLGQVLAAGLVIFYGGLKIQFVPFFGLEPLPYWISVPLTFIVIIGVTNAINLADGLDGLAGGTCLLSFSALATLAYLAGNSAVLLGCLAMMGGITGFLRFNTHPAVIFMGDSGSQFLGFTLCVLALFLTQAELSPLSPMVPFFLVGLPILDTLLVMVHRICEGRSPFKPDRQHIHHRLLNVGFDHYEAVVIIYVLQAGFITLAYFLRFQGDLLVVSVYCLICALAMGFFRWAAVSGWTMRGPSHGRSQSYLSSRLRTLSEESGNRWIVSMLGVGVVLYIVASIFAGGRLASNLGPWISLAALLLLVLFVVRRHKPLHFTERMTLYILITMMVYLGEVEGASIVIPQLVSNVFFIVLAILVLLGFRFCSRKQFQLTPLDFLVMFMAFVLPNLPEAHFADAMSGIAVAKMCVLFYATEILLSNQAGNGNPIRVGMIATLGALGARVLLLG